MRNVKGVFKTKGGMQAAAINKHLIRTKIMLEGNVTPKLVISVVGFNLESVLIVSTQLGVK